MLSDQRFSPCQQNEWHALSEKEHKHKFFLGFVFSRYQLQSVHQSGTQRCMEQNSTVTHCLKTTRFPQLHQNVTVMLWLNRGNFNPLVTKSVFAKETNSKNQHKKPDCHLSAAQQTLYFLPSILCQNKENTQNCSLFCSGFVLLCRKQQLLLRQ